MEDISTLSSKLEKLHEKNVKLATLLQENGKAEAANLEANEIEKQILELKPEIEKTKTNLGIPQTTRNRLAVRFLKEVNSFRSLVSMVSVQYPTVALLEEPRDVTEAGTQRPVGLQKQQDLKKLKEMTEDAQKVQKVRENAQHLKEMMVEMSELVSEQREQLEGAEDNIFFVGENFENANEELLQLKQQWRNKAKNCCLLGFLLLAGVVALLIILYKKFFS